MAFTTLPTVRKHLVASNVPSQLFENNRITLVGTTEVTLPHGNLLANTEIVKRIPSDKASLESAVLLTDENQVSLAQKNLVRNSVVVAADLALTSIYNEELDFRVDHAAGKISRRASGSIPNSTPAAVWYDYYQKYAAGSDYVINSAEGTIRRASGSSIADGETLLIDYTVAQGAAEDTLIEEAILEAEDIIVRALREGYNSSSTDQGLKTGSINLTLSIVARGMAALMLTRNTGSDANSRAREWQQLSEKWHTAAWAVLAPFVNPHLLRSIVIE